MKLLKGRHRWMLGVACGAALAVTARAQEGHPPTATAFVVHPDGYLLTATHVLKAAATVEVVLGGTRYTATVVGMDERHDIAVLRIPATNLPTLLLGNSQVVEVGEEVRAFGFPLARALGPSVKVTRGTVSGIDTTAVPPLLQIDATVNPGSSGGPLINAQGEVIGVVTAKLVGAGMANVGLAVPINEAKPLLQAHGVAFVTVGAPSQGDGLSLVKRVAPAVGLLIIVTVSGP
jgi:serine protease Do